MASCPRCGFDLSEKEVCSVCGYSREGKAAAAGGKAVRTAARAGKKDASQTASTISIAVVSLGLILGFGALIMTLVSPLQSAAVSKPLPSEPPPAGQPRIAAEEQSTARTAGAEGQENATGAPGIPAVSDIIPAYDITTRTEHPPLEDKEAFVKWMLEHTKQEEKYLRERWDRVQLIRERGDITHERILEGFLYTPREHFARTKAHVYDSTWLVIGYGQTISGPHLVARMTDYLNPQPGHKVLEIGTGSGYQSAFLSELSNHVYTIEIVEKLARETDDIYKRLEGEYPEFRNIKRKIDDGYYGWKEYAPFDRIIVTCGIDHIPPELLKELAPEGIMLIPVGPPSGQTVLRILKHVAPDGSISLEREDIYQGRTKEIFVPFTAKGGTVHSTTTDGTQE